MNRARILTLALVTTAVLGLPAAAASADDAPRFTLQKTDDGFVRMDTRTGEMSFCKEQSGNIVCRGDDGTAALRDEVDVLKRRIDALQRRLDRLEHGTAHEADRLPDEREFEKGLSYMDRFFRHFTDMMKRFEEEYGGEPPHRPEGDVPNRDGSSGNGHGAQPSTDL